jgi:hypothetical protein
MFSLWKCRGRSEGRSLVKLVKLAKDSATFLIKRKSRYPSQGKLVQCSGCERQKAGGATCGDHTLSVIRTGNAFEPIPLLRECLECKQELAAWVKGDVCSTCINEKMAAMHRAFNIWGNAGEEAFAMEPKTVIGPILAYRSWRVRGGTLSSLNGGLTDNESPNVPRWQPKEPMTGDVWEHGVYAHRLPKHIERDPRYVSGGVWLWGDVIEHENGFRASFGYPAFLWLVDSELDWSKPKTWQSGSRMKRLAKKYGVPLFAVDSLENLPEREGLRERLLLS